MSASSSEPAYLRLSGGRKVALGSIEEVERALSQVHSATGGSSGRGAWSRVFGLEAADLTWLASDAGNLGREAADLLAAAELTLGPEAKELLRRLSDL